MVAAGWRRGMAIAALSAAALIFVAVVVLAFNLRPAVIGAVSRGLGASVRVEGPLTAHPSLAGIVLSFDRMRLRARGAATDFAAVEHGEVDLPWSVLLGARRVREARLSGLRISLVRDAAGRANWPSSRRSGGRPSRIGRLAVQDGVVSVQDAQQMRSFTGSIAVTAAPTPLLVIDGQGRASDGAFTLRLESPADLSLAAARPLALNLTLQGDTGRSTASFKGALSPGRRGRLRGTLQAAGPDLHALSPVTGLPLPRTPAYTLTTQLDAFPAKIKLDDISGRVGASELKGDLAIAPLRNGRRLEGTLHSASLHLPDLLDVASSGQLTRAPRRPGRLLPDGPINATPLRKLFGVIRLKADRTDTPAVRTLDMTVGFDGGRITVDPLHLQLAVGKATNRFVLDARSATPAMALDSELAGAGTADFVRNPAALPFAAHFDASVHLRGSGASLAAAAAASSGRIRLTANGGRLEALQASVLSADLVRGVLSVLSRAHRDVALRCALADFQVRNGYGRADALKIVTDVGGVTGSGGLDLRTETLDLILYPPGAGPRLTAVRLQGPLIHPRASLQVSDPTHLVGAAVKAVGAAPALLARGGAPPSGGLSCP